MFSSAVRMFLAIQNTAVSLCALLLAGYISYREHVSPQQEVMVTYGVSVGAIVLASVARIASTGNNIIIQKVVLNFLLHFNKKILLRIGLL